MARESALGKLLEEGKEQIRLLYHDVNDTNLNIYLCQTSIDDINLNTLCNFFGDGLISPNIQGEYLTNILARNAFKGACNLEKTTKLFSFIYEVINPNYPGKTCNLCSLMEFVLLSYRGLAIITSNNFAFKYFIWLLNNNLKAGFDINYRDSCYNHFLVYCTLTSFQLNYDDNLSANFEDMIKKITECDDDILINDKDTAQIKRMIQNSCDDNSFASLLEIKHKLFLENNIAGFNKSLKFPCNARHKYDEILDYKYLSGGFQVLESLSNECKIYQKLIKIMVPK